MIGYPLAALHEEVAFIAYHFHWQLKDVMEMEHADRRNWVARISGINTQMNQHEAAIP